ncbi:MAG: hypothetical protein HYX24_06155 [Candidatus Aenigmarchaeota archaeon]|nr:hypothetical protein [Candidatus Aenigmarchaeota archaeon]
MRLYALTYILPIIAIILVSGCIQNTSQNNVTCNAPYIRIGTECCLDSNYNRICDKDENIKKEVALNITLKDNSVTILTDSLIWTDWDKTMCKDCKEGKSNCRNIGGTLYYRCDIPGDYPQLSCTRMLSGSKYSNEITSGTCSRTNLPTNYMVVRVDQENKVTVCCHLTYYDNALGRYADSNEVCANASMPSAC